MAFLLRALHTVLDINIKISEDKGEILAMTLEELSIIRNLIIILVSFVSNERCNIAVLNVQLVSLIIVKRRLWLTESITILQILYKPFSQVFSRVFGKVCRRVMTEFLAEILTGF